PSDRVVYPPDQLKAGQIKAPDLSGKKKLFEYDFDAPTKEFPSAGPDRYPRVEGGKYLVDNTAGTSPRKGSKGNVLESPVRVPGEYSSFAAEVVAATTGIATVWLLYIEADGQTFQIRVKSNVVAGFPGRWEQGAQPLFTYTRPGRSAP